MALTRSALSRRGFLAGTSAFAATGGFGVWSDAAFGRDAPRVGDDAWQKLANQLDGWLIRPGERNFDVFSRPYNLFYDGTRPAGIALCANSADVGKAIRWSRDNKETFVARGGGHSYAGFSTTSGLIIDLSLINETVFEPKEGTLRVGAGARNQTIYDALRRANVAITHGRCATVGAAGFLLGGGIGFNMRANGLACDQMVESEIVLADSTVLTIKQQTEDKKEKDPPARLFWACRGGGGGNFGINTSFTLQTFAAPPVCVFEINWDNKTDRVFEALMPALEAGPRELGTRFSCGAISREEHGRGKDFRINLIGQLQRGKESDVRDILEPALAASKPSYWLVREMPYWQGQALLEDRGGPARFHERSAFLIEGRDKDAREIAVQWLRDWPGNRPDAKADLRFFQTGGRIDDMLPNATAFVHRRMPWILDIGMSWPEKTSASDLHLYRTWQNNFYKAMLGSREQPSAKGAFVNFADPSLDDPQAAYYGDNLTELQDIKYEFDRDNVSQFKQSIAPKRRP